MVIDAGRIKHLGDLMHKSIASNGSAVSSNWRLSADGLTNVVWTPETSAGGVSYGSNSNEVSYVNAPGASTLVSRADHVHLGVTSLAHASNTYTGPVTLETEGGLYIVRSAANTYRFGSTGAAGGGGGGSGTTVTVARVETDESTASTTYVNLATSGPSVTVTVPASGKVRVSVTCGMFNTTSAACMGIDVSGANTVAASDARALIQSVPASQFDRTTMSIVYTGLSTGSTTFKAQYRVNAGTGHFSTREITAEPVS